MKSPSCPKFEKIEQLSRAIPGLDRDAISACVPLLYFHRELDGALEQHYQAYGLSRGRWYVLVGLYKAGEEGLTPAELADQTGVTRAAMTGLIDSLVESGHVARDAGGDDRRTYRVQLTPRGTDFIASLLPDHLRRMQGLIQALTPAERETFVGLVEKLRGRVNVFRHD
ncbi:MAG TPA: MarR family transcriptional regulator [Myxococcaceae bacterium]|nr:MarR family transcriptional regulator [Myxococcaceae bacterium]